MLLTLLLDPHGDAALYRVLEAVSVVGLAVLLVWTVRVLILTTMLVVVGWLIFWSTTRLADEAKSSSPRESAIWQGLGGLALALGILLVSWHWVPAFLGVG